MSNLKTSDGRDTGMEYGFIRMLKATVDEIKPNRTLVVFDGKLSPFRQETLPEYKSNRKHGERDLTILKDLIKSLGVSVFHLDMEADDVIGFLTGQAEEDDMIVIASSDTDFCQLISKNVKVYNPITKQYIIPDVSPDKYVLWKSMVGDKSDNIHGLNGIGPKKAIKKIKSNTIMHYATWLDIYFPDNEANIVLRNYDVISITKNIEKLILYYRMDSKKEQEFANAFNLWISEQPKDFANFLKICKDMEFHSISSNLSSWESTFDKRTSLDDIW
jgi:5'-3' exonuclease